MTPVSASASHLKEKTSTWAISFELLGIGCWYFTYRYFMIYTKTFDLMTFILNFDLVLKNFNWTISFEPYALELWHLRYRCIMKRPFFWYRDFWPCDLDQELWPSFEKSLTWAISFEPNVLELWYYRYRCIMKRPFFWYQDFWPWSLT
jgi:hypothetical protein